jgi:5-(carboxyamino)imidazole ribonucleotide mutase
MQNAMVTWILGSASDAPIAKKGLVVLDALEIPWDLHVASAHRTPKRVEELVEASPADVLIGVAGRAAALPGVLAALTTRPVIGVPVSSTVPYDSLLSIVQMPPGVVAAAVGVDRGDNAALLAAQIIAVRDHDLRSRLELHRKEQEQEVLAADASLRAELGLPGE